MEKVWLGLFVGLLLGWTAPATASGADSAPASSSPLPAPPASPAGDPSEHHEITPSCRAEVKQLCRGILPGGGRIKKCIEANESKLSSPCRTAVQERLEQEGAKK
ncbi:MAG: hypothetical protein NW701_16860 [Nitrospira sp.]